MIKKLTALVLLLFLLGNMNVYASDIDNEKLLEEANFTVKNESQLLPGGLNIFGLHTLGSFWQIEFINDKTLNQLGWIDRWIPFGIGEIIYDANIGGTWETAWTSTANGFKEGLQIGIGSAFKAIKASEKSVETLDKLEKWQQRLEIGEKSIEEIKSGINNFREKVKNEETPVTVIKLLSYAVMKGNEDYLDAKDWEFINFPFADAPITEITVPGKVYPDKDHPLLLRSQMYLDITKKSEFVNLNGFKPSADINTIRALTYEINRYLKEEDGGNYPHTVYTSYVQDLIQSYFIDSLIYETIENDHSVFLDGYNINNTAMVPMRDIFEALGATVSWDQSTKTAVAKKDSMVMEITLDKNIGIIHGQETQLPEAPRIIDGKTYIPLRMISELLGSIVSWKNQTNTVVINGKIFVKLHVYTPALSDETKVDYSHMNGTWNYQAPIGYYALSVDLSFTTGVNATIKLSAGYAPENNPAAARQADSSPAEINFSSDGKGTFTYIDPNWLGEGTGTVIIENGEIVLTLVREKGMSYFFDGTYHLKR